MKGTQRTQKTAQQTAQQISKPAIQTGARKWESRVERRTWERAGITETAETYSVRLEHGGKRRWVGLETPDLREAARKAKRFNDILRTHGWDEAFADLSPEAARKVTRHGTPTVGQLIGAAATVAVDIKPTTLHGYAVALRWLAALVKGIEGDRSRYDYKTGGADLWRAKVDAVNIADLTPRGVEGAVAEYVMRKGATPTSRRTAASMLRQARGFWSQKLKRLLPFEDLHNPFEGIRIEQPRPPKYVATFDSANLADAARRELRESDPEAWKAFLLLLGAGLRKGEADRLVWTHFDAARGVVKVMEGKTVDSVGEVPLGPEAVEELVRLQRSATGLFVLDGKPTVNAARREYRAIDTFDRLAAWLERHGVTARMKLHSLRKEAGSIVNASAGIHAASRFLRHGSIAVTSTHYADNRNRVVVGLFNSEAKQGVGQ